MQIYRIADARDHVVLAGRTSADEPLRRIRGDLFGKYELTEDTVEARRLLAPIEPTTFLCIGLNYRKHAEEAGLPIPEYPVLFVKGANAVQNPEEPILLPRHLASHEVDYEAELAVIIGRRCKNVPVARALDCVLGYAAANDVSARDWQIRRGGGQWCRGKTFDTFAPLGPCLVTPEDIPDPNDLKIRTVLNDQLVQDWNTSDMIFSVSSSIRALSAFDFWLNASSRR